MIERNGETEFDHQLHGGAGAARFQWYFLDETRLPVAVQRWSLEPGASEGMHTHESDWPLEELYLVVSGTAAMHVDGTRHELAPGDAVLAPAGSEHDLRNTGETVLQVVVVFGEPGSADWSESSMVASARAAREG